MPELEIPKQERFCQEYLIDLNATQAYIRAGYTNESNSARASASQLLAHPSIRARIRELMDARSKDTLIDAVYVVESLKEVHDRCMQARPVMAMGPGGQLEQKVDDEGRAVWQFDSNGANKALELLGKHVAMFTDKHKVDANVDVVVTGMEVK